MTYQASSPDEVALVEWAGWAGLRLTNRTLTNITLTGNNKNFSRTFYLFFISTLNVFYPNLRNFCIEGQTTSGYLWLNLIF